MNKEKFYNVIRPHVNLTTQNVMGMDRVLEYLELKEDNLRQAAYIIATAWWETAQTMHPVKEAYWLSESWRKKNLRYYPYYGRGYVQITWKENYKKASDYFGVDFVNHPDLVMEPEYALPILTVGMNEGWFTGKDLDDYIDNLDEDSNHEFQEYKNARRIVNGTDKAQKIAELAVVFEKGLRAGGYGIKTSTNPPKKPVQKLSDDQGTKLPPEPEVSPAPSYDLFKTIVAIFKLWWNSK